MNLEVYKSSDSFDHQLRGSISDRELAQLCRPEVIGHLIADKIATALADELIPKIKEALEPQQEELIYEEEYLVEQDIDRQQHEIDTNGEEQ